MCAVRTEALPCVLIKCGGNRVALICGKCFVSLGFCVYMERCRNGVASNWGVNWTSIMGSALRKHGGGVGV